MQERWKNVVLDTPEKASAFCDAFYAGVYDQAWEMTGDAEKAEDWTEKVLAEVCESFRTRALPRDAMRYLRSCMLRLQDGGQDVPNVPVAPAAPAAAQPEKVREAEPAAVQAEPEQVHPLRAATQFDADKTSLWLPGEQFDHQDLEEARQASRARPKETGNQRSVKLSIFNSMLFIVTLLLAAYVLYQLGIMMDIL